MFMLRPRRIKTPSLLQYEAAECGAAALGIVLRYYRCYVPMEELRVACGVSRDGSNALNIIKAAQHYGMDASGVRRSTLDALQALPRPLILYWNFNHFVVFEGADKRFVYINDPAVGPRTITLSEFDKAFTGLVLICKPGVDFQRHGAPFNLVRALQERLNGSKYGLLAVVIISLLLLVPSFALPTLLRTFVDDVLGSRHDLLGVVLLGMVGAFIGRIVLTWFQQALLLRLEYKLSLQTSSHFFEHMLRLPISFFAQRLSGDLVTRVQINQRVAQLLSGELAAATLGVLLMGFYLLLMLQYDVQLTLISAVFALLNFAALRFAGGYRSSANARLLQEQGKLSGSAVNGLQAIESLKASGMEASFFAQWAGLQANVINAEQALNRIVFLTSAVPFTLILLNGALILVIGGERVLAGQLSAGMLVAFQSLALGFMQPIGQLIDLGSQLQEVEGNLSRLSDVLNYPAEAIRIAPNTANRISTVPRLTGRLTVDNLSFGYSPLDAPLIDAISFQIEPGQQVALVGASGSGKSTVARLIAGLYPAWSGEIRFDGYLREALSRGMLDASVAVVDQTIVLFSGTVRENLTLWDRTISLDTLIVAAKTACIHDVIMARIGGYESRIEEGGANFSGGERQRLELARALVSTPILLILDEATSALDTATEAQILDNLRQYGCTCLMIAHRLSAIQHCDEIMVLEQHHLTRYGTYTQFSNREQSQSSNTQSGTTSHIVTDRSLTAEATLPSVSHISEVTQPVRAMFTLRLNSHWEQTEPLIQALHHTFAALQYVPDESVLRAQVTHTRSGTNSINALARSLHIRTRRIKLDASWWRMGYEPLLGYWSGSNMPVALIPNRTGHYTAIDATNPAHAKTRVLDVALASRLTDSAYVFYKPLPGHALQAFDLLRPAMRTIQREVLTAAGFIIGIGLLSLLPPIVIELIFDHVIPTGMHDGLLVLGALLVSSALAASLLNLATALLVTRIMGKLDSTVQTAVWDRLLRLPVSFFRAYRVGDLSERANGVSQIRALLTDAGAFVLVGAVLIIFNLLLLFSLDSTLALIVVGLLGIYLMVVIVLGQRQVRYQRLALDLYGVQRSLALQLISGIAKLRAADAETRAFERWSERFVREQRARLTTRQIQNVTTTFLAGYPILTTTLLFYIVAQHSQLVAGTFLAFNAAFVQALIAGAQIGKAVARVQAALPLLDRVQPILQALPETGEAKRVVTDLYGHICIERVSFRYNGDTPYLIDQLSLEIKPGEFIGIISPSGSGKSTLLRLLLGFEKAEQGEIYFDKEPLSAFDIESVRSQIGVVLQNGALISGDILTNIVGTRNLTLADAWRAARLAHIEEDIKQMPMGMSTYINEGQYTLSGGQVQRLLIARALAGRPKIVFFDEATSALDETTQALVIRDLRDLHLTTIVIAHRLSTVANAHRIFILERGRLIEQ